MNVKNFYSWMMIAMLGLLGTMDIEEVLGEKVSSSSNANPNESSIEISTNWTTTPLESPDGTKLVFIWAEPEGKGPFPAIVFFHGAPGNIGEDGLRKSASNLRWSKWLQEGYVVCLGDYRGHPQGKPFEIMKGDINAGDDVKALLRHVRTLPEIDSARVAVMGGSLGGAVTLEGLSKELDVQCAVLNAPASYDYLKFHRSPGEAVPEQELPDSAVDKQRALSKIEKIKCPILIIQGTADPAAPAAMNKKLYSLLKEAGKEARIELFEGEGHTFTSGPDTEAFRRAMEITLEFIKTHIQVVKKDGTKALPSSSKASILKWNSSKDAPSASETLIITD